jgi:hypothetical protein
MCVEIVDTLFILNPEKNKQTTNHAQGEAGDVDERKNFLPKQIPECYCQVMLAHVHGKNCG